jgi:fucose permease
MERQTEKEKLLLYGMMVTYGFSVSAVGALLPVFLREFSLSAVLGGAVAGAQGLGGIASALLGGAIADRVRKTRALTIVFGFFSACLAGAALIGSYPALLAVFLAIGFTARLLDTLSNARVADISGADRPRSLALLHAAFGVGALLGPPYYERFSAFLSWRLSHVALGLASACLTGCYCLAADGRSREPAATAKADLRFGSALPLKDGAVRLLLGSMALYSAHQSGMTVWLPAFLISRYGTGAAAAGLALSAYWAAIVAGRLIAARLPGNRIGPLALVRGPSAAGIALAVGLALDTAPAVVASAAVAGFASGSVIPALISAACGAHPHSSGVLSSALFLTSSAVRIFVPSAVGALLTVFGGRAGMAAVAVVLPASAVLSAIAGRMLAGRDKGGSDGIA